MREVAVKSALRFPKCILLCVAKYFVNVVYIVGAVKLAKSMEGILRGNVQISWHRCPAPGWPKLNTKQTVSKTHVLILVDNFKMFELFSVAFCNGSQVLCNRSLARLKLEVPRWNFGFQLEQVLCSKMNAAACWSLHVPSHQKMLSVSNVLKVPDLGTTWYDQDKPIHFGNEGFTLASHWLGIGFMILHVFPSFQGHRSCPGWCAAGRCQSFHMQRPGHVGQGVWQFGVRMCRCVLADAENIWCVEAAIWCTHRIEQKPWKPGPWLRLV